MTVSMIIAIADNNAIGINNSLPWNHIKKDMVWFKEHTHQTVVVMGSSTWASLPRKPLPNRTNVVLSSRGSIPGVDLVLHLPPDQVITLLQSRYPNKDIVIIGGAKVYNDFMPYIDRMYISRIHQTVEADTYLDIGLVLDTMDNYTKMYNMKDEEANVTFQIWNKNK